MSALRVAVVGNGRSVHAVGRAARSFLRDIREFCPDVLHVHYAGSKTRLACQQGAIGVAFMP